MPELPTDKFIEAIQLVVRDNIDYVPPYGSNGALYIRPLLFGSGPRIGLQPADQYTFLIMVIPVGDYYRGGLSKPVDALIVSDFDRAAPQGVGAVKVAGNYAADLLPNMQSKQKGFPISLYLDAKTQTVVEEFSTSNFVAINNQQKLYVTPKSNSVLPSITNKSLMQIAIEEGFTIEERDIPVTELANFDEVLAVGTAVVVTPIGSITMVDPTTGQDIVYHFGGNKKNHNNSHKNNDNNNNDDNNNTQELGETTQRLYQRVRDIQNGIGQDRHGWNVKISND
jgi:branched-chain amino acid aminotransferase